MTEVVAEIGNNHNGKVDAAVQLVVEAALAGVDAVKFQVIRPGLLVTPDAQSMVGEGTQLERLRRICLPVGEYPALAMIARDHGLKAYATFFDTTTLDEYAEYFDAIKIASGDITHLALIEKAAQTGLPVILSAGCARTQELSTAIALAPRHKTTVLHCVSLYPCPEDMATLDRLAMLRGYCDRVGYSDHCTGTLACVAAVSMGAVMIEKHFTDAWRGRGVGNEAPGPVGDHVHSATPSEMQHLVSKIRRIDSMLKTGYTPPMDARRQLMRGGYAATDLSAGHIIGPDDVLALRPATTHMPFHLIGKTLAQDVAKGQAINGDHLAPS